MQQLGLWLLKEDIHAGLVAFLFALMSAFGVPGDFIACVILALVTMRKGPRSGAFVLAWVILPPLAKIFLREFDVWDLMLGANVIVYACACMLRQQSVWLRVLTLITGVGMLAVMVIVLALGDPAAHWADKLMPLLTQAAKHSGETTPDALKTMVGYLAQIMTGLSIFMISTGVVLQLVAARAWQALLFNPGGCRRELTALRLPKWTVVLWLAALAAFWFGMPVVADFAIVMMLPFFVVGLCLLHWIADRKRLFAIILIIVYLGFLLAPLFAMVLVGLSCALDSLIDMRKRSQL